MQGLPQLLLLLQIPQHFAPDALQALHLALALVHLTLQGLHAEGQLGMEEEEEEKKRVTKSDWFGRGPL